MTFSFDADKLKNFDPQKEVLCLQKGGRLTTEPRGRWIGRLWRHIVKSTHYKLKAIAKKIDVSKSQDVQDLLKGIVLKYEGKHGVVTLITKIFLSEKGLSPSSERESALDTVDVEAATIQPTSQPEVVVDEMSLLTEKAKGLKDRFSKIEREAEDKYSGIEEAAYVCGKELTDQPKKEEIEKFRRKLSFYEQVCAGFEKAIQDPVGQSLLESFVTSCCKRSFKDKEQFSLVLQRVEQLGLLDRRSCDKYGVFETILSALCKTDQDTLVALALESGCDPAIQEDGYHLDTPLQWAIANASNKAAMALLEKAGEGRYLNIQDSKGDTALHLAVGKGYRKRDFGGNELTCSNVQLVQKMVALKADVNVQDDEGNTPLHLACARRDKEMIQALRDAGADLKLVNKAGKTAEEMLDLGYQQACALLKEAVSVFLLDQTEYSSEAHLKELKSMFPH